MEFIKDELYKYDRKGSLWDGVILKPTKDFKSLSFGFFIVVESTEKFFRAGGQIGESYSLPCQYITPIEPPYLEYDPTQQADLDSDI